MVETSIIALIKKGEQAAFKVMYQSSIAYVYAIVKRYIPSESNQEDIIQEIYARLFLSIKNYDETKGDFKSWLRKIVVNQCLESYRQGKSPKYLVPLEVASNSNVVDKHPLNELSKEEIENLLSNMPEGYRQIFMLGIIDEYSHKEVGKMLGISPETSRSQLSRAKNWIRKRVSYSNKQKVMLNGF